MKEEIIIAGFGGQGVLSMGKILAYSGIMQDQEVAWMPSYGPEMRGGTCNVSVILSDKKISSPILSKFDTAIILNQQSLDKYRHHPQPAVSRQVRVKGKARRSARLRPQRHHPPSHPYRHPDL